MPSVWTPSTLPPDPSRLTGLSAEAQLIWDALVQKQQEIANKRTRVAEPSSYYGSMYRRSFGGSQASSTQPIDLNRSDIATNQPKNQSSQHQEHHQTDHRPGRSDIHQKEFTADADAHETEDEVKSSEPKTSTPIIGFRQSNFLRGFGACASDKGGRASDFRYDINEHGDEMCSQSLFSQTQPDSSRADSPPLEMETDSVLSQLPKLPVLDDASEEFSHHDSHSQEHQERNSDIMHQKQHTAKRNIDGVVSAEVIVETNTGTISEVERLPTLSSKLKARKDALERSEGKPHASGFQPPIKITSQSVETGTKVTSGFQVPAKRQKLSDTIPEIKPQKSDGVDSKWKPAQSSLDVEVPVRGHGRISSSDGPRPVKGAPRITRAEDLSESGRALLKQQLLAAEEVALTIVYDDKSSQLREIIEIKKNRTVTPEPKAVSVALAYPKTSGGTNGLGFVRFPLLASSKPHGHRIPDDERQWMTSLLMEVLCSKTRKLAFDAQELIDTLVSTLSFQTRKVVLEWSVLDPKIACWLLDPENPPATFSQVLDSLPGLDKVELILSDDHRWVNSFNLTYMASLSSSSLAISCRTMYPAVGDHETQLCSDLSLLGPVLLQLYRLLQSRDLWRLFSHVETPLCVVLACMEQRGIKINKDVMMQSGEWLKKKLKKLEQAAHAAAGHSFLVNSHQQLRQVLFEELRLDDQLPRKRKVARTASNQHKSTSEAVLTQLAGVHPLPAIVLDYRQLQKLKSTYIDGLYPHIKDGLVHTNWDQTAAVTGRLTSANPNLQAVPKQPTVLTGVRDTYIVDAEDAPVEIYAREPFTVEEGWTFLAADFQQIELRLLAHLSKDPYLLEVFAQDTDGDIFIKLSSQWLSKPPEAVTTADREQTKRVVYSVMYGAGKDRLAEYLKIDADDAKAIMMSFLVRFPGIGTFTKKCVSEARETGFLCTLFGRRRYFPHIRHNNGQLRAQSERQAVNFCVQGSAADLCKCAMIQVEHALQQRSHLKARLLLQIHDELLLELPDGEIEEVTDLLRTIMESREGLCGGVVELQVPLKVHFTTGRSWGHMTPI